MTQDKPTIRVLSVMEATTVIGPAKNLIEFCRRARTPGRLPGGAPAIEISIATFHRGPAAAYEAARDNGNGAPPNGAAVNPFVAAARESGITVDVMREGFRFDRRVLDQLREIVERRRPDVIQTHQVKSHFLMKMSNLWRRHPWLAFHHGYTATDLKMRLYNQLDRWSLPTARRVVTVCDAFAAQLVSKGVAPDRIFVRHNSIDLEKFADVSGDVRELRERHGIAEGERVVLAVGRLSHEKGHADLVAAAGQLRRARSEIAFKLLIVGEGPERPRVERAAAEEGVTDRLVFAGQVGDVRPFYALADVMALPSHSEGSPNVLLEAMAAGVPVVATRVGGVPEIATHGETALLVAPRDAEAMAGELARVLTDSRLAADLTAKASALVAARYTPDAYARFMAETYREMLRDGEASGRA